MNNFLLSFRTLHNAFNTSIFPHCFIMMWMLMLVCVLNAQQTFEYSHLKVKKVEYSTADPNHSITILNDLPPNTPFSKVAWQYPNQSNPVAFVSGVPLTIKAEFEGCPNKWVKGIGTDGHNAPVGQLAGNMYQQVMNSGFPADRVDFYDPFEITWYMSNSAGGPWEEVGKSTHPLLITYKTPLIGPYGLGLSSSDAMPYYSCLYWACMRARHFSNESEIIDKIFFEFEDRYITRVLSPDETLYYYVPASLQQPLCYDTKTLLATGIGRCGAWARFFSDMLRLQGIDDAEIKGLVWEQNLQLSFIESIKFDTDRFNYFGNQWNEIFYPLNTNNWGAYFFVKNWIKNKFSQTNHNPFESQFPILLQNGNLIPPNGNDWGVTGQGPNPEPPPYFMDHAIVKYGNKIYDPSYGNKYSDLSSWETASVDGYGTLAIFRNSTPPYNYLQQIVWFSHFNEPNDNQTLIQFLN